MAAMCRRRGGASYLQGQKEIMDEGDAGGAPTSPSKVLRKAKSHGWVYDADNVLQGDLVVRVPHHHFCLDSHFPSSPFVVLSFEVSLSPRFCALLDRGEDSREPHVSPETLGRDPPLRRVATRCLFASSSIVGPWVFLLPYTVQLCRFPPSSVLLDLFPVHRPRAPVQTMAW
jgi:hypothetical protein